MPKRSTHKTATPPADKSAETIVRLAKTLEAARDKFARQAGVAPRQQAAANAKPGSDSDVPAGYSATDYERPSVTADIAVFTILDGALHVLLIKRNQAPFANHWALPGGFVDIDEDLADAARRELEEETGVAGLHGKVVLEQVRTFGKPGRDPRTRVISVAHAALAGAHLLSGDLAPRAADDAADVRWLALDKLARSKLAFDHKHVLAVCLAHIRRRIYEAPIAAGLFAKGTTLGDVRAAYAAITGEKAAAPAAFAKRLIASSVLVGGAESKVSAAMPAKFARYRGQD